MRVSGRIGSGSFRPAIARWCGVVVLTAMAFSSAADTASEVEKLAAQLAASDRDTRREAALQLEKLGPAAKPALPALISALDDSDQQVWGNALGAIAAIGPDAADAIPRLIEAFDARRSRGGRPSLATQAMFRAAYALACIGDAARPALIDALKSSEGSIRLGAAKALGGMGARAKDAVPVLIGTFDLGDAELRDEVVEALGLIGADAVPALTRSLASGNSGRRSGSARALGAIGPAAAGAGAVLLERLPQEKELAVREAILGALPRVGLPHEKVVPLLVSAFRDSDEAIRSAALNALLRIRPAGALAVPSLAALLVAPQPELAARAASALGRFGSEARAAVPALVAGAARTQPVPPAYAAALMEIGGPAVPELLKQVEKLPPSSLNREHWVIKVLAGIGGGGLPELTNALESPAASIRIVALGTLNELGEQAREVRPAILKLTSDADPFVRATALSALVSTGAETGATLKKIETAMRDPSPVVRLSGVTAAGTMGAAAKGLAAQIAALLDDADAAVRIGAIRAAGLVGGTSPGLAQRLIVRLDDPAARSTALEALGRLGAQSGVAAAKLVALYPNVGKPERLGILKALGSSESAASVEVITSALKDPDEEIRSAALRAEVKARTSSADALPNLVTALRDSQIPVRRTAAELLGQMGDKEPEKVVPALGALVALLASSEDRAFALEALRAAHVRDPAAIEQALALPSAEARAWACERIARLGSKGRPFAEKLKPLLSDGNDYVRRAARKALEQVQR